MYQHGGGYDKLNDMISILYSILFCLLFPFTHSPSFSTWLDSRILKAKWLNCARKFPHNITPPILRILRYFMNEMNTISNVLRASSVMLLRFYRVVLWYFVCFAINVKLMMWQSFSSSNSMDACIGICRVVTWRLDYKGRQRRTSNKNSPPGSKICPMAMPDGS